MRMRILFFALLFAGLLLPTRTTAQGCYLILEPHYNQYTNRTLDDNPYNNVHQTVQVDGYANFGVSATCQMQRAVHTPSVRNVISSYGGTFYGPGVCASCDSSYGNALDVVAIPGTVYPFETGTVMGCSMAGNFWSGGTSILNFEVAFTRFITGAWRPVDDPPPHRYYNISPYCSTATSPPDWDGSGVYWVTDDPPLIPTDVTDGRTICIRAGSSGPWSCPPAGKFKPGESYNLPMPLGNCTQTP
jgi:hypothetical protein